MSFTMYWRPAPKEVPVPNYLPPGLKLTIARHLWGHDGSLRGDLITLDSSYLLYLKGIADASSGETGEGARELAEAIREHDRVQVWIGDADDGEL